MMGPTPHEGLHAERGPHMTCAQSDAGADKAAGTCDLGILCRRAAAMQRRVSTLQLQRQSPQHPSKPQSGPIGDPSSTINLSCYLQTVSSSQFVGADLDCLPPTSAALLRKYLQFMKLSSNLGFRQLNLHPTTRLYTADAFVTEVWSNGLFHQSMWLQHWGTLAAGHCQPAWLLAE